MAILFMRFIERIIKKSKPVAIKPAKEPQRKEEIHSLGKYFILVRCGD